MRKQIIFEQISSETASLTIKNLFGLPLSYFKDRLKDVQGKWNPQSKKYQIPIKNIQILVKKIQTQVDHTILFDKIPATKIDDMIKKYGPNHQNKIKRQLYIDQTYCFRYQFIKHQIVNRILESCCQKDNQMKYLGRILIICSKKSVLNWNQEFSKKDSKFYDKFMGRINGKSKNIQQSLKPKSEGTWIIEFQQFIENINMIISLKKQSQFHAIIIDEAELYTYTMINKNNKLEQTPIKRYLLQRNFLFLIVQRLKLSKLDQMICLIQLIMGKQRIKTDLQWILKRYRKEHFQQLIYLLQNCKIYKYIQKQFNSNQKVMSIKDNYFVPELIKISQSGLQKIKSITRKSSSSISNAKQILNDIANVRQNNKVQKHFIQSIQSCFNAQKQNSTKQFISFFINILHKKIAVLIQSIDHYRIIQNYLCEQQINYCHYEHPKDVIKFNIDPSPGVCLIKIDMIVQIFNSDHQKNDKIGLNIQVEEIKDQYIQQQYRCLSCVNNILIPDLNWLKNVDPKKLQFALQQCFMYIQSSVVRHFMIIKGSYEQKWLKSYFQRAKKTDKHYEICLKDQFLETESIVESKTDKLNLFEQTQQAQVLQQYDNCPVQKGVYDIDEQFDKFQFEAMKQKQQRQKKKLLKQKQQVKDGKKQRKKQKRRSKNIKDTDQKKTQEQSMSSVQVKKKYLANKKNKKNMVQILVPHQSDQLYQAKTHHYQFKSLKVTLAPTTQDTIN